MKKLSVREEKGEGELVPHIVMGRGEQQRDGSQIEGEGSGSSGRGKDISGREGIPSRARRGGALQRWAGGT